MDVFSPNNLGQRSPQEVDNTLATAPPPPAEVKIRTMRSDLESMTASGGGLPRFQNVKVSGISLEREVSGASPQVQTKGHLGGLLITIVILILLAVGGWFVYTKLVINQSTPSNSGSPNNQSTQSGSVAVPTSTPVAPTPPAQPGILSLPTLGNPGSSTSSSSKTTAPASTTHSVSVHH